MEDRSTKKQTAYRCLTPEDQLIGKRIRAARLNKGFTQASVAAYLGVAPQQINKLERGYNRTSARNLYRLSRLLYKPVDWFLQDLLDNDAEANNFYEGRVGEMIKHINNPLVRHKLIEFIAALSTPMGK